MSEWWYERVMVRRDGTTWWYDAMHRYIVGRKRTVRQHRRDIFYSSVITLSRGHIGDLSPQPLPRPQTPCSGGRQPQDWQHHEVAIRPECGRVWLTSDINLLSRYRHGKRCQCPAHGYTGVVNTLIKWTITSVWVKRQFLVSTVRKRFHSVLILLNTTPTVTTCRSMRVLSLRRHRREVQDQVRRPRYTVLELSAMVRPVSRNK